MSAAQVDSAPAFVPIADRPVTVGRSGEVALRLLQPTISRRHATVRRVPGGFLVEDHDSRFGTFVNGTRIRTVTVRTGDRVQFGPAVAYRVEREGFRRDFTPEGVQLAAEDLAISGSRSRDSRAPQDELRDSDTAPAAVGPSPRGRRLLVEGISFAVQPDTLVGILGPSGSGKSTILHCLASYREPDRGRLLFDVERDVFLEQDAYRALLGHVPQDDVVFPALSGRENLTFAAKLRLGRDAGAAEVDAIVTEALDRVGLLEHAYKRVAALSGGQKKRLSVAIELLRRPRLILLDEPTSGLDPASEAHLMEQLRQVACRGTTVVCTTHLMDNLRLFDQVIVLGVAGEVGRIAYAGSAAELLPHFGSRGYADLYELLASGRFEPVKSRGDNGDVGEDTTRGLTTQAQAAVQASYQRVASQQADPGWRQLMIVAQRSLRLVLRDRGLLAMVLAQPVVLGLLVSLTQYDIGKILPLFFFAVVIAIWLGLNNSARDLVRERRHFVRDRLAGLQPLAYLGGKTAVQVVIGIVQLLVLLAVLRAGCGFALEDTAVAKDLAETPLTGLFLLLLVCYLGGVGLGFLASTLARTEEAAVASLPLLIIPQLLLSAVATGVQNQSYGDTRPFRPLVAAFTAPEQLAGPALLVDVASMACLSRPASLLAESLAEGSYQGRWTWVADLCHLLILLLATWTLVVLALQGAERRWLRDAGRE